MKMPSETSNHTSEVVVTFLNLLLAEEYVLYTKTRTAHWNVDGKNNFEVHVFLENQHDTLDNMIDEIAEQIRALGHYALGSLNEFLTIAQLNDDNQIFRKPTEILETLRAGHETIIGILQHAIESTSTKLNEVNTAAFLTGLLKQHKKMGQMLTELSSNPTYHVSQQLLTNSCRLLDWQD